MVRDTSGRHDKFKHSVKGQQKGGTGKAGKGTWGDMDLIHEAKAFEGQSMTEQYKEEEESSDFYAPYEVQIWNIPRGFHDEIETKFETLDGFHSMSENRNRRVMFAYFDSLENADASLNLNNTRFGKRFVGVRYSNNTAEWLLEQERKSKEGEDVSGEEEEEVEAQTEI